MSRLHHHSEWLHQLTPHLPHLHRRHAQSNISLPISTESDNQWDLSVPEALVKGTIMTKVSQKQQHKQLTVSINPNEGRILYKSRVGGNIPIESIKEIRSGPEGSCYREQFALPASNDERWITIVYIRDTEYKTVHFIAPTLEVFNLWVTTLRRLHAVRQGLMEGLGNLEVREKLWERIYWKDTDASGDKKLDIDEMRKLCQRLGVRLSEQEFQAVFKQADTLDRGYLEYPDFQHFVKVIKRRPEIEDIYNKLCGSGNGIFDFSMFQRFMREYQKSTLSDDELENIFHRFATSVPATASGAPAPAVMTMDQFRSFLLSDDNSPFSDQKKGVWQDMTRPISEYFISSSHNTYLVGNQLVGVSTVEGYIRALLHSCRTVEMDIYDGPAGEPVVYHGKTLTSKVAVRDICHAIAKYAFVTSPYPVMISAEVHCGIKQQDKMVAVMCEIFGHSLVRAPAVGTTAKIDKLPSPNDLKGKILLKAKNPSVNEELLDLQARRVAEADKAGDSDYTSESTSEGTSEGSSDGGIIKSIFRRVRRKRRSLRHALTAPQPGFPTIGSVPPDRNTAASTIVQAADSRPPQMTSKRKLSSALASLLVYTVGVKCLGLGSTACVDYAPEYVFSLSETAANRLMKSRTFDDGSTQPPPSIQGNEDVDVAIGVGSVPRETGGKGRGVTTGMWELIKHNQDHLTRIYPKGTRVNSTNYEPHRYWAAGAQVVAINWQTFDLGYIINQSMFQRNGKSGYVLKPESLRRTEDDKLLSKRSEHFLDMTIISGQQLPRPKHKNGQDVVDKSAPDPYVEVSLHSPLLPPTMIAGVSREATPPTERAIAAQTTTAPAVVRTVSVRTRSIKNNDFNPVWNEDLCIPFDRTGGPDMQELIFVNVKICQEGKDDPIAQYCIPLGCLEQGMSQTNSHH